MKKEGRRLHSDRNCIQRRPRSSIPGGTANERKRKSKVLSMEMKWFGAKFEQPSEDADLVKEHCSVFVNSAPKPSLSFETVRCP